MKRAHSADGAIGVTTLVAVGFPHATTASAAAEDLLTLEPDLDVDVDAIASISCDDRGQVHITTNHSPVPSESRGLFWQLLFTALFFVPVSTVLNGHSLQDLDHRVEASGVTQSFQARIRELLLPDTSALFLIVADDLPGDAVEALGRFGGRVLAVPLRADAEDLILHAVYGPGV